MNTLSEKTKINLLLAVVAIGGGAWWLSALHSDVQVVKSELSEVKTDVKAILRQGTAVVGPVRKLDSIKCAVNPGPYSAR